MRNIVTFVQFANLLDKRVVVSPFSQVVWLLDSEWQNRPKPDFQIDCNFTNLMCETLRTYERFSRVFDYFLCSSYLYIIYTHSRSNLCHSNVSSKYYISNLIFDRKNQLETLGREYLMSGKNRLFKSVKTIWLRWVFC